VLVLWKIGGAPLTPSDGTEIYSSSGTTCIHTGATNGQLYYYRAFSFDTTGNYSAGVSVSATPNPPPEQPSNLLALPGFTDTLLFWQPPANVDGVKVLRKLGGFPTSPTDGTVIHEGAANTATSTGLTSGNVYYYAFYSYRTGIYSEAASLTATPALKQDVDQSGDVGRYSSLALDSDGKVHISYYDNTNDDLKYITNAPGYWAEPVIVD